jgi:hypothetical protein
MLLKSPSSLITFSSSLLENYAIPVVRRRVSSERGMASLIQLVVPLNNWCNQIKELLK